MPDRPVTKMGFTLIELLVVAGVVALLLSILLPSLAATRRLAKSTDCLANLRSLAMAAQMYTNDFDYYPPAWVIRSPISVAWCGKYYTENGVSYIDVTQGPLWPYFNEKKVLSCRSFSATTVKYSGSGQISGFGINCQYVAGDPVVDPNDGQSGMTSYARPARSGDIRRPGSTLLLADCARFKKDVLSEETFIYPLYKHNTAQKNYATFHFRHRGKANGAFCDGHASEIAPLQLDSAGDGTCGWMGNDVMDRD